MGYSWIVQDTAAFKFIFNLIVFWGGIIGDFKRCHKLPVISGHGYLLGRTIAERHIFSRRTVIETVINQRIQQTVNPVVIIGIISRAAVGQVMFRSIFTCLFPKKLYGAMFANTRTRYCNQSLL